MPISRHPLSGPIPSLPGVRVDPALLAAAKTVDDGALVPEPVREGGRWFYVDGDVG